MILQALWRRDAQNRQPRLQDISVYRHQTDTVRFFVAADNLVFLVVAVEFLCQLKQTEKRAESQSGRLRRDPAVADARRGRGFVAAIQFDHHVPRFQFSSETELADRVARNHPDDFPAVRSLETARLARENRTKNDRRDQRRRLRRGNRDFRTDRPLLIHASSAGLSHDRFVLVHLSSLAHEPEKFSSAAIYYFIDTAQIFFRPTVIYDTTLILGILYIPT